MLKILPASQDNLLVVEASEKLTTADYEQIFIPKLHELINKYNKIKVLMALDQNFEGWEASAMWDDAKFAVSHRNNFEKVAIVGGPRWIDWTAKISNQLMEGEVEKFDNRDQALSWIQR